LKKPRKARYIAPVGAKGFELILHATADPKALGAELRRLRENCLVTVGDLAERMGWHSQNVSRLERGGGAREPTISSINLYVRMLGFTLVIGARPKKSPANRVTGNRAGGKASTAPQADVPDDDTE